LYAEENCGLVVYQVLKCVMEYKRKQTLKVPAMTLGEEL